MKRRSFLAMLGFAPPAIGASLLSGPAASKPVTDEAKGRFRLILGETPLDCEEVEIRFDSLKSEDGRFVMSGDRILIR